MSTSFISTVEELQRRCAQLQSVAEGRHNALVDPSDQLEAENAIAAGVAILAGEALPEPAVDAPQRSILARDLLITTDLVLRALQAQQP